MKQIGARIAQSVRGRLNSVQGLPLVHPLAAMEIVRDRTRMHGSDAEHGPHLQEAIQWLERAQDATPDDGFARGYCLVRDPYFGWRGWEPSYPETTGYIIPTLYAAAALLDRPELADRAERAARWEISIQLPSGAVRGGVMGQTPSPAVFNTGQVLFGWLAAAIRTGDGAFRDAIGKAGDFLVQALGQDKLWVMGRSRFARGGAELYNARTAWGLAEAGLLLDRADFSEAAHRVLREVAARQHDNGWFPDCCLNDQEKPLLHTLAYTTRGLIEGGRVLSDPTLLAAGERSAEALLDKVTARGWIAGRFTRDWSPAVSWSCLTGNAQTVNNWLRLHAITGQQRWLVQVAPALEFLKRTQNRSTANPGLRGGIKGSWPVSGRYGRYEVLNWATKYFADALMRHQRVLAGDSPDPGVSWLA